MAARRFKKREDFTPEEEIEYLRHRTIPELPDPDEEEGLRQAGFDPRTRQPLAEVETETKKREAREERVDKWESMSVDDHAARQAEPRI